MSELESALGELAKHSGSIRFLRSPGAEGAEVPVNEVFVSMRGRSASHALGWNAVGTQPAEASVHLVKKLGELADNA